MRKVEKRRKNESDGEWNSGIREENLVAKRRSGAYKNRFEEMKSTRRECILGREGSNKIENETESSVSM